MVNTVMNPWQASGEFVWKVGEIYREACLLAYGWVSSHAMVMSITVVLYKNNLVRLFTIVIIVVMVKILTLILAMLTVIIIVGNFALFLFI